MEDKYLTFKEKENIFELLSDFSDFYYKYKFRTNETIFTSYEKKLFEILEEYNEIVDYYKEKI